MKKALSILVVLVFVFGMLAGCGSKSDTEKQNSGSSETSNIGMSISTEKVSYKDADGASVYSIVRPEADESTATKANFIYSKMKKALSINPKNTTDKDDGTDRYEILVGDTNRPESAAAMEILAQVTTAKYYDYIICTIGKKIVINSKSSEGLQAAAEYFANNYISSEEIEGGINYTFSTEGEFDIVTVNGVNIGMFSVVVPQFNTSYLTMTEIEKLREDLLNDACQRPVVFEDNVTAESEYEIIVGNTSRNGVEKITDYDQYKITVSGKKVYINGGSPYATAMGVAEFNKMLEKCVVTDASSVVGDYNTTLASYDKTSTYTLTWGDDFDGSQIDTTKWFLRAEESGPGLNGKTVCRSGDPSDIFVSEGNLYMCAREDENYYYGGWLVTKNIMSFKYGYLEASLKMPHGDGFWSAFWTKSTDTALATPEIDIYECFGNSASYNVNCHSWPSGSGKNAGLEHTALDGGEFDNARRAHSIDGKVFGDDFHTIGMLWDSEKMAFTLDGEVFFTYDTTTTEQDIITYNCSMYLNLSLAVGSASSPRPVITDDPNVWTTTNKYILDYVHIYQLQDGRHELNVAN